MAERRLQRDITTTYHWPRRPEWVRRAHVVDPAQRTPLGVVWGLVRAARGTRAVVLDGAVGRRGLYRDLVAGVLISRMRRPPAMVILDCTWKVASVGDRAVGRFVVRLLDGPHVTYCVQSEDERRTFPAAWGVPAERVTVTPWFHTLREEVVAQEPVAGTGVFAGGDSLRDWDTLLEAARDLGVPLTVASNRVSAAQRAALPPHVTAGPLSPEDYERALAEAAIVVVPIQAGQLRGAGQTTFINAMALGKLVVVSDAPGVGEQVRDRETGLVVPAGDPRALADALAWALDPANRAAVKQIRQAARRLILERFTPDVYVEQVLATVEATAARIGRG